MVREFPRGDAGLVFDLRQQSRLSRCDPELSGLAAYVAREPEQDRAQPVGKGHGVVRYVNH